MRTRCWSPAAARQELVTASSFVIATGRSSRAWPFRVVGDRLLDERRRAEAREIPKRLAVLGGGVVAVELGQFFARVGSQTTILQRSDRIARGYDPDVTAELERAFKAEGSPCAPA
ncbi:MAG: FAD-dependent oxidoreductase [Verrucomicrobiota bacterium]